MEKRAALESELRVAINTEHETQLRTLRAEHDANVQVRVTHTHTHTHTHTMFPFVYLLSLARVQECADHFSTLEMEANILARTHMHTRNRACL